MKSLSFLGFLILILFSLKINSDVSEPALWNIDPYYIDIEEEPFDSDSFVDYSFSPFDDFITPPERKKKSLKEIENRFEPFQNQLEQGNLKKEKYQPSDFKTLDAPNENVDWVIRGDGDHMQFIPIITPTKPSPSYSEKQPDEVTKPDPQVVQKENPPIQSPPSPEKQEEKSQPEPTTQAQPEQTQKTEIAQIEEPIVPNQEPTQPAVQAATPEETRTLISFRNVPITEYIRFISRLSGKNFVFDEENLQFNITVVSEEPATIEQIMTALLQELRIHGLSMIEQANTIIIHQNPNVKAISRVVSPESPGEDNSQIITRVFNLNTLNPERIAEVMRPMLSTNAQIDFLENTNNLIITDFTSNIERIADLLRSLDAPANSLVIGQYSVRTSSISAIIPMAQQIMQSLSQGQPLNFIPNPEYNLIYIVSTPFLVERSLAILQQLDEGTAETRIFNMNQLQMQEIPTTELERRAAEKPVGTEWFQDSDLNWLFKPQVPQTTLTPPTGRWGIDENGQWRFYPGEDPEAGPKPKGHWKLDPKNKWVFQFDPVESLRPRRIVRPTPRPGFDLPVGRIEPLQFSIHKLHYRQGDQVEDALLKIASSLQETAIENQDLITALNSVHWIESSNSLVFTGTAFVINKVRELINAIDIPLRQVFIEMLILETTVQDSLNYGVTVGSEFGGGDVAGSQASLQFPSTFVDSLASAHGQGSPQTTNLIRVPSPTFNLGIIGQNVTFCGQRFSNLGLLVRAIHSRTKDNILLNPKIMTEDNTPAEIFVGINQRFPTQAISNDEGSVITQNFEFRDIGTSLKVTPHIGYNDIITLEIENEVSRDVSSQGVTSNASTESAVGTSTSKSTTRNRVHIPNKFFVVISGMIQDEKNRNRSQVPCLGGIPILGAAFSNKQNFDTKRNLMIFIHPTIVDTEEELHHLTKHQQNNFETWNKVQKDWKYEVDQALEFLNLQDTPPFRDCKMNQDEW